MNGGFGLTDGPNRHTNVGCADVTRRFEIRRSRLWRVSAGSAVPRARRPAEGGG
jgi:hypothetical protein